MQEETDRQIEILIVDDDKVLADIFGDLISEERRGVEVCYDGLEALESLQKKSFDLILADLVMPRVGGMEVLKYAKNVNPEVIVIIITGYASLETAMEAIKGGAYDYITKPSKLEEIKIVVDNAIDRIKLNRENKELLNKLQEAYHELMVLKEEKVEDEKIASMNFFSSNMPSLHYIFKDNPPASNTIDQLQTLSSLREKGTLTEVEFRRFKDHLIKRIGYES